MEASRARQAGKASRTGSARPPEEGRGRANPWGRPVRLPVPRHQSDFYLFFSTSRRQCLRQRRDADIVVWRAEHAERAAATKAPGIRDHRPSTGQSCRSRPHAGSCQRATRRARAAVASAADGVLRQDALEPATPARADEARGRLPAMLFSAWLMSLSAGPQPGRVARHARRENPCSGAAMCCGHPRRDPRAASRFFFFFLAGDRRLFPQQFSPLYGRTSG